MPNRYSHALVLSHYEARGFIALPQPSLSPSQSRFKLDWSQSNRDSSATPSLNALPALSSDSSTTSTASSLDEVPPRPLHSASSSIVTEIYAPQSPSYPPGASSKDPQERQDEERPPAPPTPDPSKQSPPENPPTLPPSVSRFSTFHNLSAFLHASASQRRQKIRSYKRHSHKPSSPQPMEPTPLNTTSRSTPSELRSPTPKPRIQQHHMSYERLDPVFSTDSLTPLPLSDTEEAARQTPPSPNEEVLPWEYLMPQPSQPAVHKPRESQGCERKDPERRSEAPASTTQIPTRRSSVSHRDTRRASDEHQKSHKPRCRRLSKHHTPADDDSIFTPIFSLDSSPKSTDPRHRQALSRASSFDSVAPPPIRKGPRVSMTLRDAIGRNWPRGGSGR
ncbi:MAG: hypothetical protein LQ338_002702 [Usnochroma carphineum]|nr:MAG: hypothetical protein LQ338_002702 [Usnochroma carphineum]